MLKSWAERARDWENGRIPESLAAGGAARAQKEARRLPVLDQRRQGKEPGGAHRP